MDMLYNGRVRSHPSNRSQKRPVQCRIDGGKVLFRGRERADWVISRVVYPGRWNGRECV
jgi:hypothetical protein